MRLRRRAVSTAARGRRLRPSGRAVALCGVLATVTCIVACSMSGPWKKKDSALEPIEAGGPEIRVRVASGISDGVIAGPANVFIQPSSMNAPQLTLATPLTISRVDGAWQVGSYSGKPVTLPDDGVPVSLKISSADETPMTLDSAPYPGAFMLIPRPDTSPGAFDIVEHVSIETYLPGVLARELVHDWSFETFRAQAIAARSYAIHEVDRKRAVGAKFDVEATEQSQVYAGLVANATARRAVIDTRGEILTWRGETLRAYYSSTSGGRQARARDIWPTTGEWAFNLASPINSPLEDAYSRISPVSTWTVTRKKSELQAQLIAYGKHHGLPTKNLKDLSAIEVAKRNPTGRPATFSVNDKSGKSFQLNAEHMRQACNWANPNPMTKEQRVMSGDCEFTIAGDTVTIAGRGFGHGVGMCQWGAEGRARAGHSAEQILTHYYPGAVITKAY